MQESLSSSLLRQMDPNQASEAELREAFCRDIDAYSFDMEPQVIKTAPNMYNIICCLLCVLGVWKVRSAACGAYER